MSVQEPTPYGLVLCTCPDEDTARAIADLLVERRLAACVNLVPGLRSIYWWEDRVESDPEVLLVAKTRRERYAALERAVVERHPYELPEVLYVGVDTGLAGYLAWIGDYVKRGTGEASE